MCVSVVFQQQAKELKTNCNSTSKTQNQVPKFTPTQIICTIFKEVNKKNLQSLLFEPTNTLLIWTKWHKQKVNSTLFPTQYLFILLSFSWQYMLRASKQTKTILTVWDSGSRPPRNHNQDENSAYLFYPNEPKDKQKKIQ